MLIAGFGYLKLLINILHLVTCEMKGIKILYK